MDEHELAVWCDEQRMSYARGEWSLDQVDLLESLPGWAWTTSNDFERGRVQGFAEGRESAVKAVRSVPYTEIDGCGFVLVKEVVATINCVTPSDSLNN
jgi:hypothetical protein